ncbi:MAG: phosphoribosyltransferase family protein [Ardenticatenales bacterium]
MSEPPTSEREELTWEDVVSLTRTLAGQIAATPFDVLLAVSRGGLVPAAVLASLLERRDLVSAALASYRDEARTDRMTVYNFPPDDALRDRRVLIVDDIWDSGHTAMAIRDRVASAGGTPIVAVLHYKPGRSAFRDDAPDHWVVETDRWIVYPWEGLRP